MSTLAALLLSLVGFVCLCASLARHERDLFGRPLARKEKRALRIAGYGALAIAYALLLWGQGFGYGTTLWCGLMTVAAGAVVAILTVRASRVGGRRR
jgi:hypothetical protein